MSFNLGDIVRCNYSLFSVQDFLCEIVVVCECKLTKEMYYCVEQVSEPNVPSVTSMILVDQKLLNNWANQVNYAYTYSNNLLGKTVGTWPQDKHLTLIRSCIFSTIKNCVIANNSLTNCKNPCGEIYLSNELPKIDYDEEDRGGLQYL